MEKNLHEFLTLIFHVGKKSASHSSHPTPELFWVQWRVKSEFPARNPVLQSAAHYTVIYYHKSQTNAVVTIVNFSPQN